MIIRYDERAMVVMDSEREWVFSADPSGRINWVHTPETQYRRSRFNQWYAVKRGRWSSLEPVQETVIERAVETWKPVWQKAYRRIDDSPAVETLDRWIRECLTFHREDAARFRSIYTNIPILPPDAYQALYIRVSEGCPWNRCAFCSFYRDRDYRVLSDDELDRHLNSVRSYWEGALGSRRGVFLGDANAVALPADVLAERLKRIRDVFPEKPFGRFHAFADFFSGWKRTDMEFERLRELGLDRICLGVESGNAELLEQIQKPSPIGSILHTVEVARRGGSSLSLIFIIGLGGQRYRDSHFETSMELLSRLPLERPDRIYLSPLTLGASHDYAETARANDWGRLADEEVESELNRWKETLAEHLPGVSTSLYNIRHFAY
jgi:radical SAM superfamily enzyme YgiQ (UPF0313 family)